MWNLLKRRRSEDRLDRAVDRIEQVADGLEERNRLLSSLSPSVGLYQTFQVDTGQGLVDMVLVDLELRPGADGRLNAVAGKVISRLDFDRMMATPEFFTR